jgi:hypothetical protein
LKDQLKNGFDDKEFERFVSRIHELVERVGSVISWDAHISDPDSPHIPRQLDVLVERDGKKTDIECRFHSKPQDSKWVEELAGRKESLKVDSIIGVSSSGFYKPAIVKAKRLGVILRDLKNVTEEEIENWGKFSKIRCHFVELISPEFKIFFNPPVVEINKTKGDVMLMLRKIISRMLGSMASECYESIIKEVEVNKISPVVGRNLFLGMEKVWMGMVSKQ